MQKMIWNIRDTQLTKRSRFSTYSGSIRPPVREMSTRHSGRYRTLFNPLLVPSVIYCTWSIDSKSRYVILPLRSIKRSIQNCRSMQSSEGAVITNFRTLATQKRIRVLKEVSHHPRECLTSTEDPPVRILHIPP